MNIYKTLLEQLAARPNAIAIVDTYAGTLRNTSYRQLVRKIEQAAINLRTAGIYDGDTVLVLQPLSLELYVTLLALLKLGATALVIDPSMPQAVIKQCCSIARPCAVVAGGKGMLFTMLNPDLRSIPQRIPLSRVMRPCRLQPELTFDAWPNMPALITFTSGSTGTPKAICRTHQFLLDQHEALHKSLALAPGTRQLVSLPIFVLANLASGVTSVLPNTSASHPARIDAGKLADLMRATATTEILASPAFVERLCDHAGAAGLQFQQINRVFTGGAPVFPSSYEKLSSTFPSATIYGVYGSTEAEPIAKIELQEISAADLRSMANGGGLLAGKHEDSVQLAIVNCDWRPTHELVSGEELRAQCLPPGAIGEIIVAGKHVVKSYLNPECNAESKIAVAENQQGPANTVWHRTGDAGYLDDRGRLWLLGRVSARITDEFGVLYPLACEAQVIEQTRIKRAAVIKRHSQRAIVVESGDRDQTLALKNIAGRSNIYRIIFVTKLPVDARHNSKVDYQALERILDAAS